jgi:hypothetical protein
MRTIWQAHDIDGITIAQAGDAAPGTLVDARITGVVDDVDLNASIRNVISHATASTAKPARALPLASIGSFGR